MPAAIYAFSLCAFALGFVEFVAIGLAPPMAAGLGYPVADLGQVVTAYALGVAVGAPLVTSLANSWSRKPLLMASMLLFVAGNLLIAVSSSFVTIIAARFISGLSHGTFLAVASSVAAALVAKDRSGSAIAFVFMGLTIALVTGVPAGTYLGSIWSWRAVFACVAACAFVAAVAMWVLVPRGTGDSSSPEATNGLKGLFDPSLLGAAGITVLAYGGAFTFYTYVATLLEEVSGLDVASISTVFLLYGLAAAVGNIVGGKFADKVGPAKASAWVVAGLVVLLLGIAAWSSNALPTAVLVVLLGFAMFAAVPILQAKILQVAADRPGSIRAAASGMNIAGFNLGITFGSLTGHATITVAGVAATPLVGAFVCLAGFIAIVAPRKRAAADQFHS